MNDIKNPVLYNIWKDRYCKNDETLDGNYRRVAKYIAQNKNEEEMFYDVISNGLFLPAGRTMSNSGIGDNLTLNNCFVAPQIKDDLQSIFDTVKLGAMTHKAGGGIGYDFSLIRPEGMPTSNDAIASGPVSFIDVFDAQTDTILQGNRRGANMGVMNVYHPDIEKFIYAKTKEGKLTHFNLSVMVDNNFMNAVEHNEDVHLHWPVYDEQGFIVNDSSQWKVDDVVNAKELWDKIMQLAYDNGEPGVFFYDNMNKDNNLWYEETIVCSNPCAEYLAGTVYAVNDSSQYGGACNLGSLILPNFVVNPFMKNAYIDFNKLERAVQIGVRMLDNIIDINKFPNTIYENYQKRYRTIGLGVTGLGDMLTMMNLNYNSSSAIAFVDNLMDTIARYAYGASIDLGKEKGSFPAYDEKILDSGYLKKHNDSCWKDIKKRIELYGIRNSKILSVAPTGTMSLTFGNNCSSGIEPIFSLEYDRRIKFGGQSEENVKIVTVRDYAYEKWLEVKDNPDCVVGKDMFVTAMDMPVDAHVKMLAAVAYHVDMSCSKTINIPTEYSFEDTKNVYKKCWESGIKGCTIFRPNPIRQGVLIDPNEKKQEDNTKPSPNEIPWGTVINCCDDLVGKKRKIVTGCGSLHVMAFFDSYDGSLQEVYLSKGSTGGCNNFMVGLSRTLSLLCRAGVPIDVIVDQLNSTGACPSYATRTATKHDTSKGSCCPMAIGNALKEMVDEMHQEVYDDTEILEEELVEQKEDKAVLNGDVAKCPECGEQLIFEGGCIQCKSCGWSRCE